jgi:hypothetical protein
MAKELVDYIDEFIDTLYNEEFIYMLRVGQVEALHVDIYRAIKPYLREEEDDD